MSRFVYYNRNPDGSKENDCVTRAISLATGLDYPSVRKKLYHTAELLDCEKLCVCCYKHLIEDVFKCMRVSCDNLSVGKFADIYPYGTYLVRVDGHISTIINNSIYDIFDCRDMIVTDAWKVR